MATHSSVHVTDFFTTSPQDPVQTIMCVLRVYDEAGGAISYHVEGLEWDLMDDPRIPDGFDLVNLALADRVGDISDLGDILRYNPLTKRLRLLRRVTGAYRATGTIADTGYETNTAVVLAVIRMRTAATEDEVTIFHNG